MRYSLMRRAVVFTVCSVVLVLGIVAAIVLGGRGGDAEPRANRKSLSQWLEQYNAGSQSEAETEAAAQGVRQIGTNALPCLVQWLQYEPSRSKFRRKIAATVGKIAPRKMTGAVRDWLLKDPAASHATVVLSGFEILGRDASPACPELGRLALNSTNRFTAIRASAALAYIGAPALPTLMMIMTNSAARTRDIAITTIGDMAAEARPAIPALIACLQDKDPVVARMAADALGTLQIEPQLVVPALARAVRDTNSVIRTSAAGALEEFHSGARSAAPDLLEALKDSDASVRFAASNALQQITVDVLQTPPPAAAQ